MPASSYLTHEICRRLAAAALCLLPLSASAATLNIGVGGELGSFDPARINGATWENDVLQDVYEGLVTTGPKGQLVPGVAREWQVSPDGKTYTFTLRENARWSDGTPVTADDFVYAWRHLLAPSSAASYAYLLYPITGARAINAGKAAPEKLGVKSEAKGQRLVVTLDQPTPYFLRVLAHCIASPLPRQHIAKAGDQWKNMGQLVTNGAFVPVEWITQSRIRTVKNKDFHDASHVAYDEVNYYNTENRQAGIMQFRTNALDIVRDVPSERLNWLKSIVPDAVRTAPMLGSYYYAYNQRKGRPTDDPRVREALSLATLRDTLAQQVMNGGYRSATTLVPPTMPNYTPQSIPSTDAGAKTEDRLTLARQKLKDAGYDGQHPLKLTLRYDTSDDNRKVAVALGAMWQRVGIQTQLIKAEPSMHHAAMHQGDFDIARAGWTADYDDALTFLEPLTSTSTNNYGAYHDEQYDRLIEQATRTLNVDERRHLLETAEHKAMSDYALMPLMTAISRNLVSPSLRGYEDNPLDVHLSRWMHPKP